MNLSTRVMSLLLLTVAAPACALAEESTTHCFKEGRSARGISFELNSNKIFLPVRVNDGPDRWFVLDSGCPVTAIDLAFARELELPVSGLRQINGAGEGRATVGTTTVKSLSLPGLKMFPASVWALEVNEPVAPYEGRRIDGLLGVDFLERFVVRIDYSARRLDVYDRKGFEQVRTSVTVPLEKRGGHYTLKAALGLKGRKAIEGRFVLDVGVRLPLLLATPFVDRNKLIEALGAGPKQTVGGGLGGETLAHLGRLESLTIADLKIEAPYVALSQEKRSFLAGDDTQGLLGAEVFRRYVLTLDFQGKRATFTETAQSRIPYKYDMSGMFLVARGDNLRTFEVLSVVERGPAAEAGIRPGDTIVELDGMATAGLTLERIRAEFTEAGAERLLSVKRRDERLTIKVRLRPMV
jgi:hypothetical protein